MIRSAALVTVLACTAFAGASAATQPPAQVDITKVTCSDLLGAQVMDRAAVVMFYWGYEAAKENVTTFKTGMLKSATQKLVSYCSSHTSTPLMSAVKSLGIRPF